MTLPTSPLGSGALALVLAVAGLAGPAAWMGRQGSDSPARSAAASTAGSTAGSSGIGDPYFPRDGNGGYDVAHYSVRDAYEQERDRLVGSTTLDATALQALSRFHLDLLLPATSVTVDGRAAQFRRQGRHELVVVPAEPLAAGATFTVRVEYAGHPGPMSYEGERTWLTDGVETVTMNEPHMAPWWFAANDHPLDKASFDIRVTHRADRQVVANGVLVGRRREGADRVTTHWRAAEPMAPYLAYFALGRYDVRSGTTDGLPWVVAVSEELDADERRTAMRTMLRSPEVVRWLETQVGPYPFSTTGGLTTGLDPGFALENQTRPTYPTLGRGGLSVVVHELAHQWFGDSVSVAGWRDIWVNEGLATWFEVRWAETHGGPSGQEWLDAAYRSKAGDPAFWRLRVDDPGPARLFGEEVYGRGAMTAQALRNRIGDAAFSTLLRTWVTSRRGGNGSSAQLEALAAEVSGTDLGAFFDAWLRSPTPPARTAANGLTP